MDTYFLNKNKLYDLLLKKNSIESPTSIGISSIADIIELIEYARKHGYDSDKEYCKIYNEIAKSGSIYISELNQYNLNDAIFEDDMWNNLSSRKINPMNYIRHLSLKKNNENVWWSELIYEQMCAEHGI